MRDATRSRKLATSQGQLIRANQHLADIDLRRCNTHQKAAIKEAKRLLVAASEQIDKALAEEVPTRAAAT